MASACLGSIFPTSATKRRLLFPVNPKICIVGPVVSPDGNHIDFSHARLDDGGRLSNLLAQKISGFLPGAVVSVSSLGIGGGQLLLNYPVATFRDFLNRSRFLSRSGAMQVSLRM